MVGKDTHFGVKGKVEEIRRINNFSVDLVIDEGKEKIVLPMPFTTRTDFDMIPLVQALQEQEVKYQISRLNGRFFGATLDILSGPQKGTRYFQQRSISADY